MEERPKSSLRGNLIRRPAGRPLPVIVLADASGSMAGEKIASLNESLRQMVEAFRDIDSQSCEAWVSVVAFSDMAEVVLAPTPASDADPPALRASHTTAMGAAFRVVRELLEDREAIRGGAWAPTLVLVSDGQPTDAWERELQALLDSERAARALRLAMAIGADADVAMLKRFVAHPEIPVVRAKDARSIASFFRFVTFTVAQRSMSATPNSISGALVPSPHSVDLDPDDLIY